MKKMLVVAGILLAVAATASAQTSTRSFAINVGAGLSLPMGDFGDFANMGFHGDGALLWKVGPKLEVGPAASFHFFGTEFDDNFTTILLGGDLNYNLTDASATAEGGSSLMPFLIGGLGMAFSSFGGESESDVYFALGAGASKQRWFGKIRFVSVQTAGSSSTFIPLTIGYRF